MAQLCALANPDAVARAGHRDGNALFDAICEIPSGVVFTADEWEHVWNYVRRRNQRFTVAIPELLAELRTVADTDPGWVDEQFPFVLSAGERRAFTANTIIRDPGWRRRDVAGALRINPADADRLGLVAGDLARITTATGTALAPVEITDTLQPGHASLPNGFGVRYANHAPVGVAPNELTSLPWRDPVAGTPWHKHVPTRIQACDPPTSC